MLAKFNDLHWLARFGVMLVVAVCVGFAFDYFVLTSTRAETGELTKKKDELVSQNAQAEVVKQRLPEFKTRFEQLKVEYDQTKELLPESVELSRVLESLTIVAKNNNLIVTNFTPKNDKDLQQDFYKLKPIGVKLMGSYQNLENFFRQISELKRVVNISNLEIQPLQEQKEGLSLTAGFVLSALYAEKTDVNNIKPVAPATKPGAAPAATTPAPANEPSPAASTPAPASTPAATTN